MAEKKSLGQEFRKGLLAENPVLRLVLGTCPTLATSTSMVNAIGMGISVTLVLLCSNIVVSLLRKVIPSKVRIPAYIVIIASFVTIIQLLIKAFVPALNDALGVFLPLIVVNCILLGRAEAFAGKHKVLASAADGLGMGIGFTAAVFCMATIREFFGHGTLFDGADSLLSLFGITSFTGINVFSHSIPGVEPLLNIPGIEPILIFILAPGGFFTFGLLMALANRIAEHKGKEKAQLNSCESCPMASACRLRDNGCESDRKEASHA